jgi:hypothetical protein
MNPDMDEAGILAQLERRLARDDPELAATMNALNQQFPDDPEAESSDGHEEEGKRRNWRRTAATVFAIIALLGLFLTAVLNTEPRQADKDPGPTSGLVPGVSVHSQRRSPSRRAPGRRRPSPDVGQLPTDPPTAYPGGSDART